MAKLVRAVSPYLDGILGESFKCLDHGYVMPVDYMGIESSIVEAARVSYGEGTKKTSTDTSLIRYLFRHQHSSPFEQCVIKFEVKMPIFVARQWIRHRTASLNEYSLRYSGLIKEFYIPDYRTQSKTNNQGSAALTEDELNLFLKAHVTKLNADAINLYEYMTGEDTDIARELARCHIPVSVYTKMVWTMDLHNLLHFCRLRSKPNAQEEIRVYSDAILEIIKGWCPTVYQAFMDFAFKAVHISDPVWQVFMKAFKNKIGDVSDIETQLDSLVESKRITKREKVEFMGLIGDSANA